MSPGFASHSRPHPQRHRIFESKPANDADRHLPPRPSAISQSRLYCLSGPMRPTQAGHHRPDRLTAVHEASRVRSLPHRHKYFSRLLAGFRLPVNRRNPAHSVPPRFATASPRLRIGNLNTFFHRPQLYRRPGKRSIARCSVKIPSPDGHSHPSPARIASGRRRLTASHERGPHRIVSAVAEPLLS